jgi:predicted nucleotidyltransferase
VARGEAHEDSDVDVLVLLDAVTFAERAGAIDLVAQAGLDAGDWVVAPLVLASAESEELVRRERSLVREIERDGVAA